jgi:hypothetical protein
MYISIKTFIGFKHRGPTKIRNNFVTLESLNVVVRMTPLTSLSGDQTPGRPHSVGLAIPSLQPWLHLY